MTKRKPSERPSLADYAASAAASNLWACPRCGCKDWRVKDSRFDGVVRTRKRECRHCGLDAPYIETKEVHVPEGHQIIVVPDDE